MAIAEKVMPGIRTAKAVTRFSFNPSAREINNPAAKSVLITEVTKGPSGARLFNVEGDEYSRGDDSFDGDIGFSLGADIGAGVGVDMVRLFWFTLDQPIELQAVPLLWCRDRSRHRVPCR